MNITDVDDKTIRDSIQAGETLANFTQKYTEIFLDDLEKLRIEFPQNIKPVTELIPEMVRMIQTMLKRGFAYTMISQNIKHTDSSRISICQG
jgi:cysteinyl-tRNA synthetase